MSLAMVGICVPTFVLGPILILVFGLHLEIFNVSGWAFPRDRVLPALTLGMAYVAYIARLTRGGMLEMLFQDFIRTARAKGVPEITVILKHALKGGLLPVVSFLGPAAAGLITGSFVVETIFQIPGLGRFFVMAAFNRDYTMIMGIVLFYAFLIIMLNTVVDVVLTMLNPRLRTKVRVMDAFRQFLICQKSRKELRSGRTGFARFSKNPLGLSGCHFPQRFGDTVAACSAGSRPIPTKRRTFP